MKLSVILSVYNDITNIEKSIKSILNQSFKDFELLIIDDGSKDGTTEVISKLAELDNRIYPYYNKENLGLAKSLNILIAKSQGEYIARHDSDDISLPQRFAEQLNYLSTHRVDGITSRAFIKKNNRIIPRFKFYIPKKLLLKYKNPHIHGTLMIKKNVINEIGNYDERFYYAQDYKLFIDLNNSNYKIRQLRKPLYVLNTLENISSKFSEEQKYFADCARKNIIPK